eukprot:1156724-Pelagomonas_calceolata.AAC.8
MRMHGYRGCGNAGTALEHEWSGALFAPSKSPSPAPGPSLQQPPSQQQGNLAKVIPAHASMLAAAVQAVKAAQQHRGRK